MQHMMNLFLLNQGKKTEPIPFKSIKVGLPWWSSG